MVHIMIMAGGIGTRFWPLSQPLKPKQFLSLIGNRPLLIETIERVKSLTPNFENLWILGNSLHHTTLAKLPYSIPKNQILEEPFGKNTAPCIGWAASEVLKNDKDAIMVILPSDHWISPKEGFIRTLEKAIEQVKTQNSLVTIGINPTHPHTGYGYIQTNVHDKDIKQVISFTEKPSLEIAKNYLKQGNYFWNSGIFVWKAEKILELFQTHLPQQYSIIEKIKNTPHHSSEFQDLYNKFEPISIDYGIMEKANHITHMIPAEFNWSDIGSWTALEAFLKKDTQNNAFNKPIFALDSNNNIIYSEDSRIILFHVQNMVIVQTKDTVLIFPKDQDQNLKKVISHVDG